MKETGDEKAGPSWALLAFRANHLAARHASQVSRPACASTGRWPHTAHINQLP